MNREAVETVPGRKASREQTRIENNGSKELAPYANHTMPLQNCVLLPTSTSYLRTNVRFDIG